MSGPRWNVATSSAAMPRAGTIVDRDERLAEDPSVAAEEAAVVRDVPVERPGVLAGEEEQKFPRSDRGASTRSATAKMPADCVKSGRRSLVIPGARLPRSVATRVIAVRRAPRPTSRRPISLMLSPGRAGSSTSGG